MLGGVRETTECLPGNHLGDISFCDYQNPSSLPSLEHSLTTVHTPDSLTEGLTLVDLNYFRYKIRQ